MEVLSKEQEALTRYLSSTGMSLAGTMYIILLLWHPGATMKMIRYIAETEESNQQVLLKIAEEIAARHPIQYDEPEEE